uniref:GRIP domain-containing protein n=1 Tax=Neobodo designis TaxID=312471 RepID=A0A7S1PMS9_NEODS
MDAAREEASALQKECDAAHIEASESRVAADQAEAASAKAEREAADLRKELREALSQQARSPAAQQPPASASASSWQQDIVAGVMDQRGSGGSHHPPGDAAGEDFDRDIARLARQSAASQRSAQDSLKLEVESLREALKQQQKQAAAKDASLTRLSRELEQRKADERKVEAANYAKNVIVQFVSAPSDDVRAKMLPALSAVLEFDANDKATVQRAFPRVTHL